MNNLAFVSYPNLDDERHTNLDNPSLGDAPTVSLPPNQKSLVVSKTTESQSGDSSSSDDDMEDSQPSKIDPAADAILNVQLAGTYVPAFFQIGSDLPVHAHTEASVRADMYTEKYRPLASAILSLSGGRSNVYVASKAVRSIVVPNLKAEKTPHPVRNFNRTVKAAWSANILRFSPKDKNNFCLVNPPRVRKTLRSKAAKASTASQSETRPDGANTGRLSNERRISPFFHLVIAISRCGGSRAGVQVPLNLVRKELGGVAGIKAVGFIKPKHYVKKAKRLGLVDTYKSGRHAPKMIWLRADIDHLESLLVRPSANE